MFKYSNFLLKFIFDFRIFLTNFNKNFNNLQKKNIDLLDFDLKNNTNYCEEDSHHLF